MNAKQLEIVTLESLVPKNHNYRIFIKLFSFKEIEIILQELEKPKGCRGFGIMRLFKCLLYQFMEDLSGRTRKYLRDNRIHTT